MVDPVAGDRSHKAFERVIVFPAGDQPTHRVRADVGWVATPIATALDGRSILVFQWYGPAAFPCCFGMVRYE